MLCVFSAIVQSYVIYVKRPHLGFFVRYEVERFMKPAVGHEVVIAIGIILPKLDWVVKGVKLLQRLAFLLCNSISMGEIYYMYITTVTADTADLPPAEEQVFHCYQ